MNEGLQSAQDGHLLRNMVLFARLLRVGDLDVTPVQMSDWLSALQHIQLADKREFRDASRAILVRRYRDLDWFESAFELFWQARDPEELSELEMGLMVQRHIDRRQRASATSVADGGSPSDEPPERIAAWSDQESLAKKDFAELDPGEIEAIKQLMARMKWRLETRQTRRSKPARRGRRIDLRQTLRRSVARGGELAELRHRRPKEQRRPLVLLCDVSGSMEPYARLLLHFIYAISHSRSAALGLASVESFAFGTHLTRLTRDLRHRDVDRALSEAAQRIDDWGGGTRTGESLKEFNFTWSRRVLGRGAVVMLISDGWDRGNIELLGREMERLRRSCHRLIWLNPLLGSPSYEPLTRGMQAALPHIDDFLPVHNLNSLEQLGELLASLRGPRKAA
ncbi:MAG: VWA domain-containing protein [Acidobacteriota bacterium]